jgi:hypothetical protein
MRDFAGGWAELRWAVSEKRSRSGGTVMDSDARHGMLGEGPMKEDDHEQLP